MFLLSTFRVSLDSTKTHDVVMSGRGKKLRMSHSAARTCGDNLHQDLMEHSMSVTILLPRSAHLT